MIQAAPIRAALFGSDQCRAEGCTVRAVSPILETCRRLTQAGYDPDRPLHCYRGDILALRVRSIGEGAALTVKTAGNGSPIFAALKGAAGSPIDWRDGRCINMKPAHLRTRREVSRRLDRKTGRGRPAGASTVMLEAMLKALARQNARSTSERPKSTTTRPPRPPRSPRSR